MVSYTSKKVLSAAVEQFSDLVLKHKLINGDGDEDALMSAVQSVAWNMASADCKENISPGISSGRFLESTYSRLEIHSKKVQNWVEDQKKLKMSTELANLTHKPSINSTSKQYYKNVPPIYTRVDAILKKKKERLASLQQESQARNQEYTSIQTARNTEYHTRHRSPKEVTTSLYTWDKKKQLNNQKRLFEKNQSEKAEMKSKPEISTRSRKLAQKREVSPIHERLYMQRSITPLQISPSFKPAINPSSEKMLQRSPHKKVFDRLYEARNSTSRSPLKPVPPPRSPVKSSSPALIHSSRYSRNESSLTSLDKRLIDLCLSSIKFPSKTHYNVLTSKGLIFEESNTNEMSFTDDQSFLKDLIKF